MTLPFFLCLAVCMVGDSTALLVALRQLRRRQDRLAGRDYSGHTASTQNTLQDQVDCRELSSDFFHPVMCLIYMSMIISDAGGGK